MKYLSDVTTLRLFDDRCTGCGMCVQVCPHDVLAMDNGLARIVDRDACMECSACTRNCPEDAIIVQAGVGCAQAVINSALGKTSSCCNLDDHVTNLSDRAPNEAGCEDAEESKSLNGSGCC
jgi:NAD-dependent dihydropyrimidine dehydrogenase PreA subunit